MIASGQLKYGHMTYAMPMQAREGAMMNLVCNRPETLVLPLTSNGYLLKILAVKAENALKKEELQREEAHRSRSGQSYQTQGMKSVADIAKTSTNIPMPKKPTFISS